MSTDELIYKTLKERFGYETFKPGQLEVIQSVLAGQATLAVLPTGTGKSLCYQLPAYLLGHTTVIISPLIALMQDQVAQLNYQGEKRQSRLIRIWNRGKSMRYCDNCHSIVSCLWRLKR